MGVLRKALVALAVCAPVLVGAATAGAGSLYFGNVTCSGGDIASGTYQSLTVAGFCTVPDGAVVAVQGELVVSAGAGLDAIHLASVTVNGNVLVGNGAFLGLGCSPAAGCSSTTSDRINGSLRANQPLALIVHSNKINGGVSMQGGGGGAPGSCESRALGGGPPFTTFEDNTINGGASISGYQSCWFGFIRNTVNGSVTISNNTFEDPDATEVTANRVNGNLACFGNSPAAQFGDAAPVPNVVNGAKLGECANV